MKIKLPSPVFCYVLVRADAIDWNVGKFMAQTNHNGTEMTEDLQEKNFPDLNALYEEWKSDPLAEAKWQQAVDARASLEGASDAVVALHDEIVAEKRAEADALKRKFGTTITLAVTAAQMRQAVSLAQLIGLHAKVTNDPTYPMRDGDRFTTASVDTCAYIFGRKDACQPAVQGFDLFGWEHIAHHIPEGLLR